MNIVDVLMSWVMRFAHLYPALIITINLGFLCGILLRRFGATAALIGTPLVAMLLGFAAARWYPSALDFFGTDTIGSMNPWYWAGTLAALYGLFLLFGMNVPEAQPKSKKPAATPKAKPNAKPKH